MILFEQFRDTKLDVSGGVAAFYPREFYPFDNFSSFQVEWRGRIWPTSEHAYQSARFMESAPEISEAVFAARSAHLAWELARAHKTMDDPVRDERKYEVMLDICRHKLNQHQYIQKKLRLTGEVVIVEDSPTDSYWGWGPDRMGKNMLGKIWMTLRDELLLAENEL